MITCHVCFSITGEQGSPLPRRHDMDELVTLIGNIGFPIAVSVYLLTVFGGKLDRMQASLDRLADVIETSLRINGSAVTP